MEKQQEEIQFNVAVSPQLKKAIEKLALENDAKVKQVVARAFINYLALHGVKFEN